MFSLVDAIIRSGTNPKGRLHVPAAMAPLPPGLVAEAVGQLAAWAAMEAVGFRRRPVAGIAAEVSISGAVMASTTLDLEAAIEDVSEESVAYGGHATAGGVPVLELRGCLGPMLPMEELEDPASARERFARLTQSGVRESRIAADAFAAIGFVPVDGEPGQRRVAELRVPVEAELFADHFPRKPVFPGTLLLESKIRLGAELAAEALGAAGSDARIRFVRAVKLRRFLSPGTVVTLMAEIDRLEPTGARVRLRAEAEGRLVSTATATAEVRR